MPSAIPAPPPYASPTLAGLMSTLAQSFAGDKTFNGILSTQNPLGLAQYTTGTLPSAAAHTGRVVYDTTVGKVKFSNGSTWAALDSTAGSFVMTAGDTMTGQLNISGAGLVVDTADNTLVVDATNNNVIIGAASSTFKLDVVALNSNTMSLKAPKTGTGTALTIHTTGTGAKTWEILATGDSAAQGEGKLNFAYINTPTDVLTLVGSSGNVGVGTNSPASKLTVNGRVQLLSGGDILFPDGSIQNTAFVSGVLTIDTPNLRVGVNSATPTHSLDVRGAEAGHTMKVRNTNVNGSSSILFQDNAATDRMRIGYSNGSFGGPTQAKNFIQMDAGTDLVLVHGTTAYHRYLSTGVVKFDDADNLLTVESATNRIGIGLASPAAGYVLDILANLGTNQSVIKMQNTSNTGYTGIDMFDHLGNLAGGIAWANSSSTGGGASTITINNTGNGGFTFRNGTTIHNNLASQPNGTTTFDVADNLLSLSHQFNRVTINGTDIGTLNTLTYPLLINTAASQAVGIRGVGTANKILNLHDQTNNKTWGIHHRVATENNRMEFWYFNGSTDNRMHIFTTDGKIGVNNTVPSVELDVTGAGQFSTSLTVDTNSLVVSSANHNVGIGGSAASGNKLQVFGKTVIGGDLLVDTDVLVVDSVTNRVGINNSTPSEALHVTGNAIVSGTLSAAATSVTTLTASGQASAAGVVNTNAQVTPASGTGITVQLNGNLRQAIYRVQIANTAWTAAALTQDITLCTIPAKARVTSVVVDTTVAYTGTGATTYSLRVGKTTGGQEYILDHSVLSTNQKGLADADLGTSLTRATAVQGGDIPSWTASTDLKVRLTSDVNIVNITAGTTVYYITVEFL